ncbi:diaminopimelate epimerase [Pseudoroseicyclus aestuarii]|uniref:Diaminopimelate epimerase n=1 Tax=Pseudoroseicyclus aestuarii TaxID=1795041 RepID=A0A318SR76_9RHOB|nr:diaminopimelate epimerase [Pseudoroseicyclus aestuarii]PYE84441.1 diaminopimelate epimerase [Pseudoroseicyclus aestuarii]
MQQDPRTILPFMKMHGLGNDFVVVDARGDAGGLAALAEAAAPAMADRQRGVGYDQLAVIEDAAGADLALRFLNADGSPSATCGNATRCIAAWEMARLGQGGLRLRTERGVLEAVDAGDGLTSVNMGQPLLDWAEIPLVRAMDTLSLPIPGAPTATGMGNPHCTFFVEDAEAVDLAAFGPEAEHDPLFPQRTNVQWASLLGPDRLRMRVWERGAGITLASGSSSCAVAVAAARRGLTGRRAEVVLDGGTLVIDWREDGVWMTGPTAHVFDGEWRL